MDNYNLVAAATFTDKKLSELRDRLTETLKNSPYKKHICVIATGSYGRDEASSESDIDWYIIFDKDRDVAETIPNEINSIKSVINDLVPNSPGDTGTFDAAIKFSEMQKNIGGDQDTNQTLTRRMLFLLEGTWLFNEQSFKCYREDLLKKYIKPSDVKNNVPRFLLNDIIRYYRTITTDFEYKVSEANKEWGLRNIKLKFSRKLLYISGVLVAAELHDLECDERIAQALALFSLTPLARIKSLTGNKVNVELYEQFLQNISKSVVRLELKEVKKEDRKQNITYVKLNDLSEQFSQSLISALKSKYSDEHPIHQALII